MRLSSGEVQQQWIPFHPSFPKAPGDECRWNLTDDDFRESKEDQEKPEKKYFYKAAERKRKREHYLLGKERGVKRKHQVREDILHGEKLDYRTPEQLERYAEENPIHPVYTTNHFFDPPFLSRQPGYENNPSWPAGVPTSDIPEHNFVHSDDEHEDGKEVRYPTATVEDPQVIDCKWDRVKDVEDTKIFKNLYKTEAHKDSLFCPTVA